MVAEDIQVGMIVWYNQPKFDYGFEPRSETGWAEVVDKNLVATKGIGGGYNKSALRMLNSSNKTPFFTPNNRIKLKDPTGNAYADYEGQLELTLVA
jgi:hypothetical protein